MRCPLPREAAEITVEQDFSWHDTLALTVAVGRSSADGPNIFF